MTNTEKVIEFLVCYPGHDKTGKKKLAERLGVSISDIEEAKQMMKDEPTISDYEDFVREQGIKEEEVSSVWYKGKHFSINAKKPKVEFDEEGFIEKLKDYKVPDFSLKLLKHSNCFAVINLYDAHVDKLSFTGRGGKEELENNLDVLWEEFKNLLAEILNHNPSIIILPIGNDFFTTNGREQTTRAGTPQHRTTHWHDSFEAGVTFYRRAIDMIRQHCDCLVINIPGNHDHDLVLALGTVIKALYKNAHNVILKLSKEARKYVNIGECLLGFGHGKTEHRRIRDLPTAMAIETDSFSRAKYRIFFLGDKHHAEEYSSLNKLEHNGVEIRFLRAATNEDEWHNEMLWIGARKSVSCSVIKHDGSQTRTLENFF